MKIETKFGIGQEVWFILYGKVYKTTIKYICCKINEYGNLIVYEDKRYIFKESELYGTREEAEAKLKEMQDEV